MRKRVLITGGAGFIAHHVVEHLLHNTDWDIITLDRLDYSGNLNRLDEVVSKFHESERKRVKVVFHDLKAPMNPQIRGMIGQPNYILHLAAGSHVDRSIEFPLEFVYDNVIGTANLLEYARFLPNLEGFLYFSTDEVFGPAPSWHNFGEWDRYNASNPYSASKAGAEELCVAYQNTYKMPIMITHTMNVFGERQNPEKFIPLCIQRVRDGELISIHADATKKKAGSRFYIHAIDVSEAIFFCIQNEMWKRPAVGDPFEMAKCPKYNIVGKEEIDNLSLARRIANIQKKELIFEMVDFHGSRPGHDLRYALSGEVMRGLGWVPRISLTQRIYDVTEWSLAHPQWLLSSKT